VSDLTVKRSIPLDLAWGAKRGLLLGAVFAGTLGAAIVIRGPATYAAYSTPFWAIVLISTSGGLVSGLCVGLLRPIASRHWGVVLVGILGGTLAMTALMFVVFGTTDWNWWFPMLGGAVVGARAGSLAWAGRRRRPPA
jgi:hypothetical protein